MILNNKIAVIIPCYRVKNNIIRVLTAIDVNIDSIYLIDDFCPENTSDYVKKNINDKRVKIIINKINMGVGGAVKAGYQIAIKNSYDIIIKLDGDGQADPSLIKELIMPIINKKADYVKGNRFYNLELKGMPLSRIFGNAILSFLTKISSGYWNIFDPTNGFTAIHINTLKKLKIEKINNRYFFESDMLFRLNIIRAVIQDYPMKSKYGDEVSSLKIYNILFPFIYFNIKNTFKRIIYNYYLRDLNIGSFELPLSLVSISFGVTYGVNKWLINELNNSTASAGMVMMAALPILIGVQLFLSFINKDIENTPKIPLITQI